MQREKQNERRRVSYERVSRLHDYLFFLDFDFLKLFEPDACLANAVPSSHCSESLALAEAVPEATTFGITVFFLAAPEVCFASPMNGTR